MEPKTAGITATLQGINKAFGEYVVGPLADLLFFDLAFWDNGADGEIKLPFIVCWLIAGAIFFTLRDTISSSLVPSWTRCPFRLLRRAA